jgi:8-oxo-dGTP diphosphatase
VGEDSLPIAGEAVIRVAAGILRRGGKVLVCQRRRGGPFALKWEFPGGKLKEGESAGTALRRELEEELGIMVPPGEIRLLEVVRHGYAGGPEVELHFFAVGGFTGKVENLSFEAIAWAMPERLGDYDFLEADRPLVARIAAGGLPCDD